MLSGNPSMEQFDKLLTAFEAALADVIGDKKLKDSKYVDVDIPNELIKSFARETWNILAGVKSFRESILKDTWANRTWVSFNGYSKACEIQASGPIILEKIQKFLKSSADHDLPEHEKNNIKSVLKESKDFLGFFYDIDKKQARSDCIDVFLKHMVEAPTIAAVPGFSGLLRKYFDGYQHDGLPKFIEELAVTLENLEQIANKEKKLVDETVLVIDFQEKSQVQQSISVLEEFMDEKPATDLRELVENQRKLQEEFKKIELGKKAFNALNFSQIKIMKSKNEVLLENVRTLLISVQEQYYAESETIKQKKEQLEINREKLKKDVNEQNRALNLLTDAVDAINTKLSQLDAIEGRYNAIANKLSAYWFGSYRNDTDEIINKELNEFFDIKEIKESFGERLGFRFSNAAKWTFELRKEWEAFLKHERLMLQAQLQENEKKIVETAQKNTIVLDMLAIDQEISVEQIRMGELDLRINKSVYEIKELIIKNTHLQALIEELMSEKYANTKKIIADCKQSIDRYKKNRSTQYAFSDFVEKTTGMAVEKIQSNFQVKMEFKPEKEKRNEYLVKLENALDLIAEHPDNPEYQGAYNKILEEGRCHTFFKPRVKKAATLQLGVVSYRFTLQSCLDEIEEKTKALQGVMHSQVGLSVASLKS